MKDGRSRDTILEDKPINDIPDFYRSISGSPLQRRLKDVDIRQNVPRIVEYLEGEITILSTSHTYPIIFQKYFYKEPPLIAGLVLSPDGKVTKIPTRSLAKQVFIRGITTNECKLYYSIGDPSDIGKKLKYKFRVYNLSV